MAQTIYSVLKFFTGFAIAAFIAWKLTVANAIIIDAMPPARKTHQLNSILKEKFCNHLFMKYQAIGVAIANAIEMSRINSFENK